MADWSELKRLAEAAQPTFGSFDPSEDEFDFMSAITPDVILALIAENEQLREDHDKQWRLAQSGIQNIEAVLAENAKLRAESEAMASLLRRFVENEHNPSEDQNERHWYHGEAETLLAKISGKHRDYALVPEESLQRMVSERDQLRVEVEALRKDAERIAWLAVEGCYLHEYLTQVGPRYGLVWPILEESQMDLFEDPRAAIDAAMGKGGRRHE